MFGINAKANLTLPEIAVAEQEVRAERKNVLDQFKRHEITSKVTMDGLRRCDEMLAQLQKKRKHAKKS